MVKKQKKKLLTILIPIITLLIIINFIDITTDIYKYKNNTFDVKEVSNETFLQKVNDKEVIIKFSKESVKIVDCYKLNKEEKIEVLSFVITYLDESNIS